MKWPKEKLIIERTRLGFTEQMTVASGLDEDSSHPSLAIVESYLTALIYEEYDF